MKTKKKGSRTYVAFYTIKGKKRVYDRSFTVEKPVLDTWKAFKSGMLSCIGVDVDKERAENKRKGGKGRK
jgi:hypothetical protein